MEKKNRLTINFSKKAMKQLNEMAKELSLTKIGTIRMSLSLLKYIIDNEKKGLKLFLRNKKMGIETQICILS